jgi:hypothetical protein
MEKANAGEMRSVICKVSVFIAFFENLTYTERAVLPLSKKRYQLEEETDYETEHEKECTHFFKSTMFLAVAGSNSHRRCVCAGNGFEVWW